MYRRRDGFTLIELLVVIAIIALLMSIMLPALGKVKTMAQSVICRSNIRQWAVIWEQYTDLNDGYFTRSVFWVDPLRELYGDMKRVERIRNGSQLNGLIGADTPTGGAAIRLCPRAKTPRVYMSVDTQTGVTQEVRSNAKDPFMAWGIVNGRRYGEDYYYDSGSYGMNGWLCNPELGANSGGGGRELANLWRTPNVKGANLIPMFVDCRKYENMTPRHTDEPGEYEDELLTDADANANEMRIPCINRHEGTVNGAFVDFSVRKIGLKELWKLKWHRSFDLQAPLPVWPDWMRGFRDY